MKYLKVFETETQQNEFREGEDYLQPHVSCLTSGDKVKYNQYSKEYYEMLKTPLTFEALEDDTEIVFYQSLVAKIEEQPVLEIEISTDDGDTWITKQAVPYNNGQFAFPTLILNAGEKVLVRGNNEAYGYYSEDEDAAVPNGNFYSSSDCYVYGNIMSLIDGNNFFTLKEVTNCAFSHLFHDYNDDLEGSWLLSHPGKKLLLPATTLANHCYNYMFCFCANLTTAPELPATTLAAFCYNSMFSSCTSLTIAPNLPATTLANACYSYMFSGCTSLTTVPELPATTLASNCYQYMFTGCTSLTTAPELPATTLANACYSYMFRGCTSLITAPELPATTLASNCYQNMFAGCTSLATAPELPATTLAYYCYNSMFHSCINLTTAQNILPAQTLNSSCYAYMFYGCRKLIKAPVLPALTLVDDCYAQMFKGCISLNYIKALFTTTPGASYTNTWVQQVSSSGTFVKNVEASWTVINNYGIPTGWYIETASS